jgi:transcription-repair coupling factor (superfamily II helicase)
MRIVREARGDLPIGLLPAQANWSDLLGALAGHAVLELSRFAGEESGAGRPPFSAAPGYGGRVRVLARDLAEVLRKGESAVIVSQQASRLATILTDEGVPPRAVERKVEAPEPGVLQIVRGSVPHGWRLAGEIPLTLLTDGEVFGFVKQRRAMREGGGDRSGLIADLTPGDYVVHIEHGIARFAGMATRTVDGVSREFLELHYAESDRLFVPVDQADRVARYVGPGDHRPALTKLGSGEWARTRDRVRRAVADIAKDLLELYASRQVLQGHAFSSDTPWQQELEASFPYVETPDQLEAIQATKSDMEAARPMDRLICGDVGYGKTEVAIRAAFKAVMDGYQVAVLVPTTVLAQQHYNTFKERLASLPCRVEMLSRFLNDREARAVTADLAEGSVDIIIGTHRLLQKDVLFKKLGLVIVDEEQRFGVSHKERLKQMRQEVDVLTLSATPIPRTLHMSLIGIRDMSNMVTPPEDRLPIRTYVMESDDQIIREAIVRELERGGQVFFVHNRVYNIEMVAARIRRLVPEAEVGIGHGQMHEDQLEATMLRFAAGEIDVLVCTTIIESGLDIPNANTIIINHADKLGLAQLYQLRGRVGRGAVRAYAYLLYERNTALSETAQRRLQAIFEATELGAGFQIALKDLEIRGAGNLLGAEQSGHMAAVGFDLYVRLLGEAVERLKAVQRGETPPEPVVGRPAVVIDLPLTAYLPEAYVPDLNLRLALYQRLSRASTNAEVDAIEQEMRDRFGELPGQAKNLTWVVRLRLLSAEAGLAAVQTENGQLVLRVLAGRRIKRESFPQRLAGISFIGSHQVRLDLERLGEGWREGLVRALAAIPGAVTEESA